jgi:hypothetical protein
MLLWVLIAESWSEAECIMRFGEVSSGVLLLTRWLTSGEYFDQVSYCQVLEDRSLLLYSFISPLAATVRPRSFIQGNVV